ncbi:MAG: hypothetical protein L0H23_10110 [Luteimonas sp.]|nr:hypothetical protein [Luteimonas sp.]
MSGIFPFAVVTGKANRPFSRWRLAMARVGIAPRMRARRYCAGNRRSGRT